VAARGRAIARLGMLRLGLLASHAGSLVRAVVGDCRDGRIDAMPAVVIANNADAEALAFARAEGIPARHLSGRTHPDPDALDRAILEALEGRAVDLVLLLGYRKRLRPATIAAYRGRILNVHPGPLPRYGGQGMYGEHVHRAVLAAGERESAATIHQVDEIYDHGAIVAASPVPVAVDDTPDTLGARVRERERALLCETLRRIASGELRLAEPDRGPGRSAPCRSSPCQSAPCQSSPRRRTAR